MKINSFLIPCFRLAVVVALLTGIPLFSQTTGMSIQQRIADVDRATSISDAVYYGKFTRIHGREIATEHVMFIHHKEVKCYVFSSGADERFSLLINGRTISYFDFSRNQKVVVRDKTIFHELPDRGFSAFALAGFALEPDFHPIHFGLSTQGGVLELESMLDSDLRIQLLIDSITSRPVRVDFYTDEVLHKTMRKYYYDEIKAVKGERPAKINLPDKTELFDLVTKVMFRLEFFEADFRPPPPNFAIQKCERAGMNLNGEAKP